MPRFSIVIPSYSNVDGLRQALESIVKFTDLSQTEVIVVANGAPDLTRELVNTYRYHPIKLIWIPEAIGYTAATNIGLKAAHPESQFLIPFNDDCLLLEQQKNLWIDLLVAPFNDPLMAITGPVLHRCFAAEREFLIFFCVMIRKSVMDEIGILDEIFSPGSGEDTEWCCRAIDAGWKMQQVPPQPGHLVPAGSCPDLEDWQREKMWSNFFPLYHKGNQTFAKIPHIYEPAMQKNHAILKERYNPDVITNPNTCPRCNGPAENSICIGGEQGNCDGLVLWRAHAIDGWFNIDEGAWLAQQVKNLPPNSRVLEIGSWHGRSSRFIADNLSERSKAVCCDTWCGSSGEPDAHLSAAQREGDHAYSWWICNLWTHVMAGRVVPFRIHSANGAETLSHLIDKDEMEKFDLIFIDGDHSAEGIKTDVEAWLPLLKEGGLLCGHDYYKENEGPWWVHVRQEVETRWPNVEKSATSIWHVRPSEVVIQVPEFHRGYRKIVTSEIAA